jgi:hypothetical protein
MDIELSTSNFKQQVEQLKSAVKQSENSIHFVAIFKINN